MIRLLFKLEHTSHKSICETEEKPINAETKQTLFGRTVQKTSLPFASREPYKLRTTNLGQQCVHRTNK